MATPAQVISPITIATYMKEAEENAYTNHPMWGLLREKGSIVREDGGTGPTWPVHGGWNTVHTVSDFEDLTEKFVQHREYVQANLPWGEKLVVDVLTSGQMRQNRGERALVKWQEKWLPSAMKSLLNQGTTSIAYDFINADGTGSGLPLYGLRSIFKNFGTGTSAKDATISSGTYAGQSLVAGDITSIDNAPDDYIWSPRGINYGSSQWTASSWVASSCLEVMDYAEGTVTFDQFDDMYKPDCFIGTLSMYNVVREALDSAETIFLSDPKDGAKEWGKGSSIQKIHRNGIPIYWDSNQRSGEMNLLNFDFIRIVGLDPIEDVNTTGKQWTREDPEGIPVEFACDWSIQRRAYLATLTAPIQFAINPRYQANLADYS